MNTTHTPGPWIYQGSIGSPCGITVFRDDGSADGGRVICDTRPLKAVRLPGKRRTTYVTTDKDLANASLICAAPDMLAALEAFTEAFAPPGNGPTSRKNLQDAYELALEAVKQARRAK